MLKTIECMGKGRKQFYDGSSSPYPSFTVSSKLHEV